MFFLLVTAASLASAAASASAPGATDEQNSAATNRLIAGLRSLAPPPSPGATTHCSDHCFAAGDGDCDVSSALHIAAACPAQVGPCLFIPLAHAPTPSHSSDHSAHVAHSPRRLTPYTYCCASGRRLRLHLGSLSARLRLRGLRSSADHTATAPTDFRALRRQLLPQLGRRLRRRRPRLAILRLRPRNRLLGLRHSGPPASGTAATAPAGGRPRQRGGSLWPRARLRRLVPAHGRLRLRRAPRLCKILFDVKAFVHKSIILVSPPPTNNAPHYCHTIAILLRNIRPPPDPPFVCHKSYNIGDGNIV